MDAAALLRQLGEVIDGHRWEMLGALLHEDFSCRYVHTGEQFDRDTWVRLNAEYPGFERFVLEDVVACGERAVGLARVTGAIDGRPQQFAVATFVTAHDGLISEMTEVWTDIDRVPPGEARPS